MSSSRSVTARLIALVMYVLVMERIDLPGSQYEPSIVVGSSEFRQMCLTRGIIALIGQKLVPIAS